MRFLMKFALVLLVLCACVHSSHRRPVPGKLANWMPATNARDLSSGMAKEVTEETMSTTEDKETESFYEDYPRLSKDKDWRKGPLFLSKIKKLFSVEKGEPEPETGTSEDYATEEPSLDQMAPTTEIPNIMVERLRNATAAIISGYLAYRRIGYYIATAWVLFVFFLCLLAFCCFQRLRRQRRRQQVHLQIPIDLVYEEEFEKFWAEKKRKEKAETKDSSVLRFIRKVLFRPSNGNDVNGCSYR